MQQQQQSPPAKLALGRGAVVANESQMPIPAPTGDPAASAPAAAVVGVGHVSGGPPAGTLRAQANAAASPARLGPGAGPMVAATATGLMRGETLPLTTLQLVPLEVLTVMVTALLVAVGVAAAMRSRRRARECDFLVRGNAMRIHEGLVTSDPIVEAQGDRPSGGWRRRASPVAMVAMVGGAGGEGGGGGGGGADGGAGGGGGIDGDDSSYSTTDAGEDWSGDADDEATGLEARGDAPPAGDGSESVMMPRGTTIGGQDQEESEVEEAQVDQLDYSSDYIDEKTIENFIIALITQQAKEKRSDIIPHESSSST